MPQLHTSEADVNFLNAIASGDVHLTGIFPPCLYTQASKGDITSKWNHHDSCFLICMLFTFLFFLFMHYDNSLPLSPRLPRFSEGQKDKKILTRVVYAPSLQDSISLERPKSAILQTS